MNEAPTTRETPSHLEVVGDDDEEGNNTNNNGEEEEQERVVAVPESCHRLVLPEDGYEWKKYGQKFIKNIAKFRSYYRCEKANCKAKKRVEWSKEETKEVRIVYEGVHFHPSSSSSSSSSPGKEQTEP